jgi:hypothetical protein
MNKPKITIIELPSGKATEAAKAQWWRQHIVKLSKPALAQAIGVSVGRIDSYERGYGRTGKPFSDEIWDNYKRKCYEERWQRCSLKEWNWGIE